MTSVFVTFGQAVVGVPWSYYLPFLSWLWGKQPPESWRSSFQDISGGEFRWLKVEASPDTKLHLPIPLLLGQSLCCSSCQHFWTLRFYSWVSPRSHHRLNRNTFPNVTSLPWGAEMGVWKPSTFLPQTERTLQGHLSPGSCIRSAESFIMTASQLIFSLKSLLPSLLP